MAAVLALAAVAGPPAAATSAAAKAATLDSASVTALDARTAAVRFPACAQHRQMWVPVRGERRSSWVLIFDLMCAWQRQFECSGQCHSHLCTV
jgi:hypothetical protein